MVNLIGVKVIEYLKFIGTFIGVIAIFYCGKLKAEKKRLEENLEEKESEIKGINETQERIAKYDNTPVSDKRSWLRSRSKAK
jgi:hypothetical protein|tara:strand:+ start:3103 stop:3348 length:246 start_codon:yes stop_codon:yes gene_type:complete